LSATVIWQAIDAALGSTPTGNLSRHSVAEKSRCTSILSPERPMTLAPAAAKFSMFSANQIRSRRHKDDLEVVVVGAGAAGILSWL
jgi:hypothetical protein